MASTDAVSNADLVHITGAGTRIVVATRAGNTNYVGSMAAPEKEHTISINQVATTTVTCGAGHFTYSALRSRLARQMHRITEQAAALCGMVKTPNPASHERDSRPDAEYHPRFGRTQEPHPEDEARTPAEQEAEDAHNAALR